MAKFNSHIIDRINGPLGNASLYPSRYGNIMRAKTHPKNTITVSRTLSESRFGNTSKLWAKVTIPQHKGWVEFAKKFTRIDKVGVEVACKAMDIFKMTARNLIEINMPPVYDAPKKIIPKTFKKIDVEIILRITNNDQLTTNLLQDIKLHFKPVIDKNVRYNVFATSHHNLGTFFFKPCWYRKIDVIGSEFISGSSIFNKYISVFPSLPASTFRIGLKFVPVSTVSGLTGNEIEVLAQSPDYQNPATI